MENNQLLPEFELILHAGNSKSSSMKAMELARSGNFKSAQDLINEAQIELNLAHQICKDLVVREASGEFIMVGILMVHAQDHLNTAMLVLEQAVELIHIYSRLEKIERVVNA